MRLFRITLITTFLVFTSSCSVQLTKGLKRSGRRNITTAELFPLFPRPNGETMLFNMQIDRKESNFSGLLVVKQIGDTYRAVFNSHFGMSIFDFEFTTNGFKVNKCAEMLNRPIIIKTLEKDLRNLLYLPVSGEKAVIYKSSKLPEVEAVKIKKTYFLRNTEKKYLAAMEIPNIISSLHYTFIDQQNNFPQKIEISHSNIGLRIQLDRLQKQKPQ